MTEKPGFHDLQGNKLFGADIRWKPISREEAAALTKQREEVGRIIGLDPQNIRHIIERFAYPTEKNILESVKKNKTDIQLLLQQHFSNLSPVSKRANAIKRFVAKPIEAIAYNYAGQGIISGMSFWYDYGYGIEKVFESLLLGEALLSGYEIAHDSSSLDEDAQLSAQMLRQDMTGLTIVHTCVNTITAESQGAVFGSFIPVIKPYHIPEFVIAGAKAGENIYEALTETVSKYS